MAEKAKNQQAEKRILDCADLSAFEENLKTVKTHELRLMIYQDDLYSKEELALMERELLKRERNKMEKLDE